MSVSNSDIAAPLDITHKRGDSFVRTLEIEIEAVPVDLTGYSIRMQVRAKGGRGEAFVSASIDDYISVSGAGNNVVNINIPGSLLNFNAGTYAYDIEFTSPSGIVQTWLTGSFVLSQDITQ